MGEHGLVYKYFHTMAKYNPSVLAWKFLFGQDDQTHSDILQMALIFLFEFGYKRYLGKDIVRSLLESGISMGVYYIVYEQITQFIDTEEGYAELLSASVLASLLSNIIDSLIKTQTIPSLKQNTRAMLIDFGLIAISGFISIQFDNLTEFLPFSSTTRQEVLVLTILILVAMYEISRYVPVV